MNKPLKYATQAQALEQFNDGSFVYHNPCCVCKKECSTPTIDIWKRRIAEFGSIAIMYTSYTCRKCRKGNDVVGKVQPIAIIKADDVANVVAKDCFIKAPEPMHHIATGAPMMKKKQERPLVHIQPEKAKRKPGEYIESKPGEMAFSIWEDGVFKGTAWHKTGEKLY